MDNKEWDAFSEESSDNEVNDFPAEKMDSLDNEFHDGMEEDDDSFDDGEDDEDDEDEDEDDEYEINEAEEEEFSTKYLPPWNLSPNQRITYKTVAGAIGFLTLFLAILFWVNGPKAFERIQGTDLEKDGLKGPVKSVEYFLNSNDPQFSFISTKPARFVFYYDEIGNRIREDYSDETGRISSWIVYTYDSEGNVSAAQSSEADDSETGEIPDKRFGLFDPIDCSTLKTDPNISQTYYEMKYDSYGNWTNRMYHIRRHSRLYEPNCIGAETRTIEYFIAPPPTPPKLWSVQSMTPNSATGDN